MKTLTEQLKCAQRELVMRQQVYPGRIERGQTKPESAAHELECMQSIINTLEKCKMLEEVSQDMAQRGLIPAKECMYCGSKFSPKNGEDTCPQCS